MTEINLRNLLWRSVGFIGGFITSVTVFESNNFGGICFGLSGIIIADYLIRFEK